MKTTNLIGAMAVLVLLGATGPVFAVSPPPVPFIWTGCYIGGNVGAGWGLKTIEEIPPIGIFGGIAGGQVGCDYQVAPHFLIGALAHFDAADINGTVTGEGPDQASAKVSSLLGAGGRVGYVNDGFLAYVVGGAAWARDNYSVTTCCIISYTGSETRAGAFVGVGAELYLWPNISVFGEFDHYFMGTKDVLFTGTCLSTECEGPRIVNASVAQDINTFRVGVNVRFSGFWMMPSRLP